MSVTDYDHLREPYTPKEDEIKWIADFVAATMAAGPTGRRPGTSVWRYDPDKGDFHWLHLEDNITEPTCESCMEVDGE